jgi:hypothetical protein
VNAYLRWTLKALGTAVASLASAVITAYTVADGMTGEGWLVASAFAVLSGLAVFGIRNGPDPRKPQTIDGTDQTVLHEANHIGEHRAKDAGVWAEPPGNEVP